MSYARPGSDSSVYVWAGVDAAGEPLYFCDSCVLCVEPKYFRTKSLQALWDHLKEHRRAGHKVPDRAFAEIARDMQKEAQRKR